jgi:hypothetical protein
MTMDHFHPLYFTISSALTYPPTTMRMIKMLMMTYLITNNFSIPSHLKILDLQSILIHYPLHPLKIYSIPLVIYIPITFIFLMLSKMKRAIYPFQINPYKYLYKNFS